MDAVTPERPALDAATVIASAKELLKDITPGEWSVAPCSDTDETRDIVVDYQEVQQDGRTVKQAHWIAEITGDFDFESDDEPEFQKIEANAQFIARCNPKTITKVVDAMTAISPLRLRKMALYFETENLKTGINDREMQDALCLVARLIEKSMEALNGQ